MNTATDKPKSEVSPQVLAGRILVVRGQRVVLDSDLAQLYEVETKRFNEQIRRNLARFPSDFMFHLSDEEYESLRSQFATSKPGRGGRRYLPWVFTEHGAIMAASVLNSERAVQMSIYVVRAFVQLREFMADHKVLAEKLDALERRVSHHDHSLVALIDAIRSLTEQPKPVKRPIGFTTNL